MDNRQTFAPFGPDNGPEELGDADQVQAFTQSFGDFLDGIDFILETNAEAFIQGFVQRGGQ